MKMKHLLKNIICLTLCCCLMMPAAAYASVLSYETQKEYTKSDIAWLSELTVKTGLDSISAIAGSATLIPISDYPYRETAETFSNDVDRFTDIYLLREDSPRAAYVYLFELLSSVSGSFAGELSDTEIAEYLNDHGVKYDFTGNNEEIIVARALYTALATGTVAVFSGGESLDSLAIRFIEKLSGMNGAALEKWLPSGENITLDEYILAAARCVLWNAGYDVSTETDEKTVYRLIACMTIEANGITADSSADFSSLKLKFLAAMLAKKYGVSPDPQALGEALESKSVALYMLRLIGRKHGVSVGERSLEDAFAFVAEQTHEFDLETGEFYADIYDYGVFIPKGTSKIWINPEPVCTEGTVTVTVDGVVVKNAFYTAVEIDPEKETQKMTITVNAAYGTESSEKIYTLTLYSGDDAPEGVNGSPDVAENINKLFFSSETMLAGILSGIGLDSSVSNILDKSVGELNIKAKSVMEIIAPTFDGGAPVIRTVSDEECFAYLDKIGQSIDCRISGIDGIDVLENKVGDLLNGSAVTFDARGLR